MYPQINEFRLRGVLEVFEMRFHTRALTPVSAPALRDLGAIPHVFTSLFG